MTRFVVYTFKVDATDPNIGDTLATYQWDFGDGSAVATTTAPTSTHIYLASNATGFPLKVRVADNQGNYSEWFPKPIPVDNSPSPITVSVVSPDVAQTYQVDANSTVTVNFMFKVTDANASATIGASDIKFKTGDPAGVIKNLTEGPAGTWTCAVAYAAASKDDTRIASPTLQVTDSLGISSDIISFPAITIRSLISPNHAPDVQPLVVTPAIVAGPNATWKNVAVTFTGAATDQDGDTMSYSWTFTDGGLGDVLPTTNASAKTQTHTFTKPGTYRITFTIDDSRANGKRSAVAEVNILDNSAPVVSVTVSDPNPKTFAPVTFTANVVEAEGDVVKVTWDFGDTFTDTTSGAKAVHVYKVTGPMTVKATVDDGKGGLATWTGLVNVVLHRTPVCTLAVPAGDLSQMKAYGFNASATDPEGFGIKSYEWNFGDGTPNAVTSAPTVQHFYGLGVSGKVSVSVRATDNTGAVGDWCPVVPVNVVSVLPPVVTFPSASQARNVSIGGTVDVELPFNVTNPNAGQPGVVDPIPVANIVLDPGDAKAVVVGITGLGGTAYRAVIRYSATSTAGTRKSTPQIYAMDSLGIRSVLASAPQQTINTTAANHAPTIAVTNPATTAPVAAFTSKTVHLDFVIKDVDGDPLSCVVDWGDGTTPDHWATSTDTTGGVTLNATHTYPDSFNASSTTPKSAVVTITALDGRSDSGSAAPQTRTFSISFNTLPTVTITSPQGSGTSPSISDLPSNHAIGLANPAGATDPDLTVIPKDGPVTFASTATPPGSGDAALTYQWTFEGGIPSTSTDANPGQVVFPLVTPGAIEAHLVTVTVTDLFGRNSATANPNPKTYKKWVVVDGKNSQIFSLKFMYRQKSEDLLGAAIVSTLSPAMTAANGLGTSVKIFQDGAVATYAVQDQKGQALASIPVRSNLPFYVSIPPFGSDTFTYMFRVPNAPIGTDADPALGTTQPGSTDPRYTASGFWFQYPTAGSAPWNPVLQVVTGEGFGPEVSTTEPRWRKVTGTTHGLLMPTWFPYVLNVGDTVDKPDNNRWIDRLTMPGTAGAPTVVGPWGNSDNAPFQSDSLQSYGDWLVGISALKAAKVMPVEAEPDSSSGAPNPADMGFVLNHPKYAASGQNSESFAAFGMQATRVPPHTADPFNVDVGGYGALDGGWNASSAVIAGSWKFTLSGTNKNWFYDTTTGTVPKALGAAYVTFFGQTIWKAPTAVPLSSGIDQFLSPFEINYSGLPLKLVQPPYQTISQAQAGGYYMRTTSSYAEYLWSKAWARPIVLNRANLNAGDYKNRSTTFPWYRYSSTPRWPSLATVTGGSLERPSRIDMTPSGGNNFMAGSPVALAGQPVTPGGVGRFYWTAAAPIHAYNYSAQPGLISRTWLSDDSQMPPLAFNGDASDAISSYGLFPPQTVVVDKRTRDTKGNVVNENSLGGYRITWYNPTQNAGNGVVAPDFWVVEVSQDGVKYHYLLPANFPGGPQHLSDPIMTDARSYLPSGNTWGNPSLPNWSNPTDPSNDQAAPGFCWFDVPKDLQPVSLGVDLKSDVNLTVFAVKAILKNNPASGARALTRVEWMEAVKNVTANVQMTLPVGDFGYAHKLPFNYYWDIVVAQSATVTVKP